MDLLLSGHVFFAAVLMIATLHLEKDPPLYPPPPHETGKTLRTLFFMPGHVKMADFPWSDGRDGGRGNRYDVKFAR